MDKKTIVKLTKIVVYNLFFVGTLYFALKSIDISSVEIRLPDSVTYLILSVFFFFLFYLLLSLAWSLILDTYSEKRSGYTSVLSFLAGQVYKYLPSSLFGISFRILYSKKLGFSVGDSIRASLFENLLLIYTSFWIFLSFYYSYILFLAGLIIYLIGLLILKKGKKIFSNLPIIKKIIVFQKFSYSKLISAYFLQSLGWLVAGLALFVYQLGFQNNNADIVSTISAQSVSYTVSILAVFAPGGLGIKEYFLNNAGITALIVINWRLLTVAMDIIISSISIIFIYKKSNEN